MTIGPGAGPFNQVPAKGLALHGFPTILLKLTVFINLLILNLPVPSTVNLEYK